MAQKNADITMRLEQNAEAISSLLRESFGEFESIYNPESKTIHEPTQNKEDHIFPSDRCDFVDRLVRKPKPGDCKSKGSHSWLEQIVVQSLQHAASDYHGRTAAHAR
jgi:hypothetical protein